MQKKISYPTGVENHGGFLRVWFIYLGKRHREALGLPDTPKNRKLAGEIRQTVTHAIRTGTFDYARFFPESGSASQFDTSTVRPITIRDLFTRWMELKKPELSLNAHRRYGVKLETCCQILGPDKMVSSLRGEDLLSLRNELLNGYHRPARGRKVIKQGRSVATVNDYMTCANGAIKFAVANGYIDEERNLAAKRLKRSKTRPDPLTPEEFPRFIAACANDQTEHIWTLAVYTGLRQGELCAVAWEDIDLEAGTLTVRRNWTSAKQYTLPKTEAGTDRVIYLMEPALAALKKQQSLTRVRPAIPVTVHMREIGKTRQDSCTFVFDPAIFAKGKGAGDRFTPSSLGDSWDRTMKRAKLRHRNAYQSRHTYACWTLSAGGNPAFIATQMGHASAQMLFNVYGDWIPDHNADQLALLNDKLGKNAPHMPHGIMGHKKNQQ